MSHNRRKQWVMGISLAALSLVTGSVQAYVGLCCGKCGGNMPMNIPGGGVPETHEYRVKISPMVMSMDGLRDGTSSVNGDSLLGMPAAGLFMAVPTSMEMRMLNITAGYSFTDDLFGGVMMMWKQYEVMALPTTYLIGRDGRFAGRVLGAREWNSTQGRLLVQGLLQQTK